MKNIGIRFTIIAAVVVGSIAAAFPLQKKVALGLDLKGGMHLVYKVDTSKMEAKDVEGAADRAVEIIRNRIDELGVKEPVIQPQGTDKILIQLPGIADRDRALGIIGRTALLEFKLVEENADVIKTNTPDADAAHEWMTGEDNEKLLLVKKAEMNGSALKEAAVGFGTYGEAYVSMEFNADGAKQFGSLTAANIGRRLAVVLDGKVRTAPSIREAITSGEAQITGRFTVDEAKDISLVLRSGALPCPLIVEEERTVGPLLGQDSISKGKMTMLGALVVVALFMVIYYLFAGLVAVFALALNLLLIMAGLALMNATLTLPGIAGIVLTLGMAVDANVLIYERIREELELKRPIDIAMRLGFQRAFLTILDSNLTTVIAGIFLFVFGTGPIKGFGVTLIIGLVASMFTALYVCRTVLEFLFARGVLKSLPMLRIIGTPNFDYVKMMKPAVIASALLVVACVGMFIGQGKKIYGVDFAGGQVQEYRFTEAIDVAKLRTQLEGAKLDEFSLYEFSSIKNAVAVKTAGDTFAQVKGLLDKEYAGKYAVLRVDKVGPVAGKILREKALLAIFFALAGILAYVALRFKHFDFGLAGVIALFHDIVVAVGLPIIISAIFPGFVYKVDLLIVTAALTLAGFSINDTIVIYDRIRETRTKMHKATLAEVINVSINQTMSRTIITTLTVFLTIVVMLVFGPENLKPFSWSILIGLIAGTYSTVFIASPVVVWLRKGTK
jgi:SecD/SecF fusion protein